MVATEQTPLKKVPEDREKWSNQCDFFLSCLGYAVGLGNVWRFPYLCYQHGGGSFLVAYVSMLLLTGLPLFTLELSLGQYSSVGPSQIFKKLCPASKGVGWAMVSVSLLIALYYNQIIAWSLFYMYEGMAWELPWKLCGKDYNSIGCFTVVQNEACLNASKGVEIFWNNTCYVQSEVCESSGYDFFNLTHCQDRQDGAFVKLTNVMQRKTASEDFFTQRVLGLQDDSTWENMGSVQTHAVVSLAGAWALVAVCMLNGIRTSGKVVYFTALFPFLVLILLFVRGLTLDGAYDGILFYVTPKWDAMWAPQMWADAATQIFYSLGTTMGGLVTLASYNRFNNNCLRDALIITCSNCATSIFAGFVIFCIVGFMAKEMKMPISEVIQSGPGLTFVAYPDAVTRLPGSTIWSFLFFMMILTLGLDTQFAMTETVTTAIMDQWPQTRRHKIWVVLGSCSLGLAFGVLMCFNGGIFVFQLLDWYSASWNLMLVGFLEVVIVMACLGYQGVMNNLEEMQVRVPLALRFYYGLTWRFLTPLSLGAAANDVISGDSLSFAQDENEFISMAKKVGLRFVDGKDREDAEDLGNDEEFLLDLFESKNLHKMAQIVGQMNHAFTHQPSNHLTEQSAEEPEMSTHKLPMKSHTHTDDSPTELVVINNVAEPIYWESPGILTQETTTSIPEYLTETLYYFEKDKKNLSRPFARTPRTPKSLDLDTNASHKSRKILQVFEDPQDEQDHMMMMLHNAVAMVELEDVLQTLRPIPFNDEGNRAVLRTQPTRRPPVQSPAPNVSTRKIVKKPRKQPGRLRAKSRRPRPTQVPTQNPTFVLPESPQLSTTLAQRPQNDITSRFTPRPAPRFNTEQSNTLERQGVSRKIFPVQDFFPESRQSPVNTDFTPQISSPPPSLSPTPATPTTPRPLLQNRFAVTQPTLHFNTLASRTRRPAQPAKFSQVPPPVQPKPQPVRRPTASPPPRRVEPRFLEPSPQGNRLLPKAQSSAPSRQGKQISNEVQQTPSLTEIPKTSFSCGNQAFPGLYADPEADCQVFYMCHGNGRQNGFLCPAGTLFDQRFLVCNWWHKVDCSRATSLYGINEGIYQEAK